MYKLEYLNTQQIYLEGSSFEVEIDHSEESCSIFMDGGYEGSKKIIFFEIKFLPCCSLYYEIDQMWGDVLEEKYDITEIEGGIKKGIYKVRDYFDSKMEVFDPKKTLNLAKFIIVGQYCFCEIIANANFEISEYQGRNNSEIS